MTEETPYQQVLDDHRQLRRMVNEIREYIERPRPDLDDPNCHAWATQLSQKVLGLHEKLFHHFQEEEISGYLDDLAQAHPRALRSVENLRAEHDEILEELRGILMAAMVYGEGREPSNPRLRTWMQAILDKIHHHDEEETELYMQLDFEDLGEANPG